DAIGNSFPVDVKEGTTIGHFKELIKKKKENTFFNIDANKLNIWSVNIPVEDEDLETKIYAENIKEQYQVARYNYMYRNTPDHKDHMFILIPGGIGIGKTRMGWESKHLSSTLSTISGATEFVEALKDPCYVFIDLNNGCNYIRGFDDVEIPSVRIGTRVAVASGLVPECPDLHKLLSENNPKLFELSNVIREILQRRFKIKQHSIEAIIIHIDEYQLYINDAQQHQQLSWIDSRNFFKSMLREIGSVMRGNRMKYEYYGKYFIVPICTGTSAIDIHFLPTEYTQEILELKPLNYISAKSMFLDKYDYSRQTTDEGRDLMVQGLKSYHSSDINNEDVKKLSVDFCNLVLNQQHFHIAIFDTGFIPKFIDDLLNPPNLTTYFDWGNQLFTKISQRNVTTVGNNPGDWKSLKDIRTVISFGLTGHHVMRDFLLPSCTSIGELERAGLIYLSNFKGYRYTIVMPFMLLKVLNNVLLVSGVETVFPDHLLLIPTHVSPWQWKDFELLYGYYQKALIDSLINVKESKLLSIDQKITILQLNLEEKTDSKTKLQITKEIGEFNEYLANERSISWQLSDIFRGALGADTLLQRKVRLHNLKVFTESKKFLVKTDDVASFDKSVLCDDNVTRSLEEGIFHCYQGNANIDYRWILDSADNGKKLAIFSQIKYSERGVTTTMSTPDIKDWYDITMKSIGNYKNDYDVVLVLFTNRKCTGKINIETMPHLLLIYPENLEKYLSSTFAHRGLVDRPGENNY
ncbi:6908_t:CDS:2, partial [Acaulospora morrowiae]